MEKAHPQTAAAIIGKYSCLAQCYIYCMGIDPAPQNYIKILLDAQDAGETITGIDAEYTVNNAEKFLNWLTGKRYNVNKKVIATIADIKEPTPVKYYAAGYTPHFVVVENGQIIFDPLENSISVMRGRPIESRPITLAK